MLRFMLHVCPDGQLERLRERGHDPLTRGKHNNDDDARRAQWDDDADAYEDPIRRTTRKAAPWFVVPADRKWVRSIVVMRVVVSALEGMDLPPPPLLPADLPAELQVPPT